MSKVLGFLARDLRHLRSGAIVAVVVAGIVAVPSFYAWFNIAGSWDPYGNTGNVRVAVANEDDGAGTALLPWRVNVGERVVGELRTTDSIGYVVTSREDALEGVRSGAYYAAIVIPPEFSRDVLSALSADPVQARAIFYQNEKANPIAAIVTDKASSAVRAQIDARRLSGALPRLWWVLARVSCKSSAETSMTTRSRAWRRTWTTPWSPRRADSRARLTTCGASRHFSTPRARSWAAGQRRRTRRSRRRATWATPWTRPPLGWTMPRLP